VVSSVSVMERRGSDVPVTLFVCMIVHSHPQPLL
jgi:hypothetical protein